MQILPRDLALSLLAGVTIALLTAAQKKRRPVPTDGRLALLTLAMACAFSLTGVSPISGFHWEIRLSEISLVPFAGMRAMLRQGFDLFACINIVGNILLFAPLGVLVPRSFSGWDRLGRVALLGFGTSLWIECSQLFLSRSTDVDDLLLNTLGAVLGYAVWRVYDALLRRKNEPGRHSAAAQKPGSLSLALCLLAPYAIIVAAGAYDRYCFFHVR